MASPSLIHERIHLQPSHIQDLHNFKTAKGGLVETHAQQKFERGSTVEVISTSPFSKLCNFDTWLRLHV